MLLGRLHQRPKVLVIGGPDIDARAEMMQALSEDFHFTAVGVGADPHTRFLKGGFEYHHYPMTRRINPAADLRTLFSLVRVIQRCRPDLVHAFDTKPCVFARVAARIAGVPAVIGTLPGLGSLYASDSIAIRATRKPYEILQGLACRLSDLTIFQNQTDAQELVNRGVVPAHKTSVVYGSGIRTDLFDASKTSKFDQERVRRELGISNDAPVVTMISRLIRSKGVKEFVAAARTIGDSHPQAEFVLVGPVDDQSVDKLTSAERSETASVVKWTGARSDISAVLAASDVFVLPSFYREGIPRVLLEAASMCLPIITTDSPGCNEVVSHGVNGFLVPARDSNALAQAILQLVENPEMRQRFGQRSRQHAVSKFDFSKVVTQIRLIYQQLLTQKGLLPSGSIAN